MTRVYRLAIANAPATRIVAALKAAGFSGTIQPGAQGFTPTWGDEPSSVIEIATSRHDDLLGTIADLLQCENEQAAYLTVTDSVASLLWADGHIEALDDSTAAKAA